MSDKVCKHKEWIGRPVGYVPASWQCCDCNLQMSAGEFETWKEIRFLRYEMEHKNNKSEGEK